MTGAPARKISISRWWNISQENTLTSPHSHVHDFADLLSMSFTERSTKDSEVLAEDENLPATLIQSNLNSQFLLAAYLSTENCTMTSHNSITIILIISNSEFSAAVSFQHVVFSERSIIEQQ
jgi:hypothetical protein